MPSGSFLKRIIAWSVLFFIISGSFLTAVEVLRLVNTIYHIEVLEEAVNPLYFLTLFILIGIGIVSLVPILPSAYARASVRNPAVTREILRENKTKNDGKELGILFLTVGLTILIEINPWFAFYSLRYLIGAMWVTTLMAVALALLMAVYVKQLRQYVKFSDSDG
jgi:hypothetical protein